MKNEKILSILFLLFLSLTVNYSIAKSGSISANPRPCLLNPGQSNCAVSVSWSSENANSVCVWRIHPSLDPAKWRCSSLGSGEIYNYVDKNGRTLELRENSSSGYSSSNLLDSVFVSAIPAPQPQGSINASPKECIIDYGEKYCSTTINWSSDDADSVCVWRVHPSLVPAKWKCGASNPGATFASVDQSGRIFELRENSGGSYSSSKLLDSVEVRAVKGPEPIGTITATPNACEIGLNESQCSVQLSWSSDNSSSVCVWIVRSQYSPIKWKCGASGENIAYASVSEGEQVFELRSGSQGSYSDSFILDSATVRGDRQSESLVSSYRGGSNLGWFYIDETSCLNNKPDGRFKYDVVSNFHITTYRDMGEWGGIPRNRIINLLNSMYESGQRSFRLPIYHRHCGKLPLGTDESDYNGDQCGGRFDGTSSASDAGSLPDQTASNIIDLLSVAYDIGFENVILGFFPSGSFNSPNKWDEFNYEAYEENKGVIDDIVQRVSNSSVNMPNVFWDLRNEHVPALGHDSKEARVTYGKRLWSWWKSKYPHLKSIGFSVIASSKWQVNNRFPNMHDIYGGTPPDVIAVHLYSYCDSSDYTSSGGACDKESDILMEVDAALNAMNGYGNIPLIISEVYYDDIYAAEEISYAASLMSRDLEYVIQWPRRRGDQSNCFQPSLGSYIYSGFGL